MKTGTIESLVGRVVVAVESRGVLETTRIQSVGRGHRLDCQRVESVAANQAPTIRFSQESLEAMARSERALQAAHARGDEIYGLTTGFGPLVKYAADEQSTAQGAGLIAHLGAGCGPYASAEIARATMLLRCHTIGQGCSGIDIHVAEALADLLASGLCPAIPEIGSVGASGDLIPLSHVGRVLMGEGRVLCEHSRRGVRDAGPALIEAGLAPVSLTGRDALALVNGTTFMSAYAALAVARTARLIQAAERITGWLYRLIGCRAQALDPRLHAARGHDNQSLSAARIAREAWLYGHFEDASRPLQEVYSLRCTPQFLGACRDQLDHARTIVEREINGVSDNPVVCGDENAPAVLHGGNFQGQQIAFASDALNQALVQTAILAERQLDVLVNPDLVGGTLLLAWQPGATSGVAGAQITASALIAEMRHHGHPCSTSSVPTNGRNQDVVSMGTMAARQAFEQTDRLATVLSILCIAAQQLAFLRERGRVSGRITPLPDFVPPVDGIVEDRPLHDDIEQLAASLISPVAA
ncbi:MAG: aromatic amino acid ammonia-lyase [Phycisphaerales bacterium]|nr:aromatic amino acid ammonia-lyase [Phycisphaerales bacterium]